MSTTNPDATNSDAATDSNGAAVVIGLESALVAAAASRYDQLRSLPDAEGDPLVSAQRDALSQTIHDIAAARRRVEEGTFGTCTGCGKPIPTERLKLRPWAETCVSCVGG